MRLVNGECLEVLRGTDSDIIDSLVTDPPAGIAFMNKSWDKDKGGRDSWIEWMSEVMEECHRVLKPGAHGLVWALPRTSHWTATACEDAGFEIRDSIHHVFGTGFPKSLNISKAIDKAAGAKREVTGVEPRLVNPRAMSPGGKDKRECVPGEKRDKPVTPEAKQWDGYGTALKPSHEIWWLIRKPISEKTVAKNVLRWGVGGLNIDKTRVKQDALIPVSSDLKPSTLPVVFDGILESFPGSFSEFSSLSLLPCLDFLGRIFSELDSYSITDKALWRSWVVQYRSLCNELPGVLCDYGLSVEHVVSCAQRSLEPQGSQSYYPILSHFYDGLFHATSDSAVDVFPSVADVRACIFHLRDSQENTPLIGSNLHLACVWVFAYCLYKTVLLDIQPARFPSNFICSGDARDVLDGQSGESKSTDAPRKNGDFKSQSKGHETAHVTHGHKDSGGASRFFYCAKASKAERNLGCEGMEETVTSDGRNKTIDNPYLRGETTRKNHHPTVKSQKLMRYLTRMVTPPGGTVLDPFMGSGSTGVACKAEGFDFMGIEMETEYFEIAEARINV